MKVLHGLALTFAWERLGHRESGMATAGSLWPKSTVAGNGAAGESRWVDRPENQGL